MSRDSLFIFFVLFETLLIVCSGEETFNPFSSQQKKKSILENAELTKGKELSHETNEVSSDEKVIEKRKLYFNEEDPNSPPNIDRHPENNEYLERRRTNYSEPENEPHIPEFQQRPNTWENERNRFSLIGQGGNFRAPEDNRPRQLFVAQSNPNQRFDWEKRGDVFGKGQPRRNEDYRFNQFENSPPRMSNNYNGRPAAMFTSNDMNSYPDDRNQDPFSRRVPVALNDRQMAQEKSYNERMGGDTQSGFVEHPNGNYYNRNPTALWSSNFNTPEKGVIINFNTECPKPSQFSGNQLVHKFIFTPKTSLETLPDSDVISSPRLPQIPPMFYL